MMLVFGVGVSVSVGVGVGVGVGVVLYSAALRGLGVLPLILSYPHVKAFMHDNGASIIVQNTAQVNVALVTSLKQIENSNVTN